MAALLTPSITDPLELHVLYILLDSNLPTGGFVSSSGLESFAKHAFLTPSPSYHVATSTLTGSGPSTGHGRVTGPTRQPTLGPTAVSKAMTLFGQAEVENYARSTGPFVISAWEAVSCRSTASSEAPSVSPSSTSLDNLLSTLLAVDKRHEACLLSHVSRRSSKAQGVALLTLFSRGLSRPPGFATSPDDSNSDEHALTGGIPPNEVIEGYKRLIRKGAAPGHLAICWGIMTAALGLPLERSLHLYLFLHARSLLSSAVRLNLIGPYLSSQLLLHPYRSIIDTATAELVKSIQAFQTENIDSADDAWTWVKEAEEGPATTWPLGEVLMARHDLQHSRIFNS